MTEYVKREYEDRFKALVKDFNTHWLIKSEECEAQPICAYWFGDNSTILYNNGEEFHLEWNDNTSP